MSDARVLDDAPWLRSGPTARVLELLNGNGEEARVVGGAVRNALLRLPVGEIDVATTALPEEVVRRAVRGMLPRTRLGRQQLGKLKVYAGAEHPHQAQQPEPLDVPGARVPS